MSLIDMSAAGLALIIRRLLNLLFPLGTARYSSRRCIILRGMTEERAAGRHSANRDNVRGAQSESRAGFSGGGEMNNWCVLDVQVRTSVLW